MTELKSLLWITIGSSLSGNIYGVRSVYIIAVSPRVALTMYMHPLSSVSITLDRNSTC